MISDYYKEQNRKLHKTNKYGKWGYREAENVTKLKERYDCDSVLDFGAGQCSLSKAVNFPVTNFDPAVKGIDTLPEGKFDLCVCSDVMEHIEPEYLEEVLQTIRDKTAKVAYFVIATSLDGTKTLPDGRDPHLIVMEPEWWVHKLSQYFTIKRAESHNKRSAVRIVCLS